MPRFPLVSTAPELERAILVGVDWGEQLWPVDRSLDELSRLAETAGAKVVGRLVQRLDHPNPKSFLGSGKVYELRSLVVGLSADVVIFDDDLTPSQQTFLERAMGGSIKIIDRTALILDIFGLHAMTREGRLQVQLAQLQYLLPRLRGMWSHLAKEQTRGGIGSRFGQGESQLELDRRMIRGRISVLRRELSDLEKRRIVQSGQRVASQAYRIALAGYTNAGKSSLLNALTGSNVLSQDKLFATLDPTTRCCVIPGGRHVVITDTVGFIQKLPHGLVDAFKSTLAEVKEADLILRVVDISDPDCLREIEAVDGVLNEIHAADNRSMTICNKSDLLNSEERQALARRFPDAVFCSALTGFGVDELLSRISACAAESDRLLSVLLPYSRGELVSHIHKYGMVLQEEHGASGTFVVCKVPKQLEASLCPYLV